jgi:hypothetical protein
MMTPSLRSDGCWTGSPSSNETSGANSPARRSVGGPFSVLARQQCIHVFLHSVLEFVRPCGARLLTRLVLQSRRCLFRFTR